MVLLQKPTMTSQRREQAAIWRVRKGLYPSVGAVRQKGTSVIIEDIVFPLAHFAQGIQELQGLFQEHHYDDAIIFGHAKEGNIHFVITQGFQSQDEIQRYQHFMNDLVKLVLQYDGALKAEHGTGRNMAPFVEAEWGGVALQLMQELKVLFDPHNCLNPGVIINSDPKAHLKDLKRLPIVG